VSPVAVAAIVPGEAAPSIESLSAVMSQPSPPKATMRKGQTSREELLIAGSLDRTQTRSRRVS
jgi:hypothetical protein